MSVQRKTVVPVILEKGLALNGWLGIVLGTKLYFEFLPDCLNQQVTYVVMAPADGD